MSIEEANAFIDDLVEFTGVDRAYLLGMHRRRSILLTAPVHEKFAEALEAIKQAESRPKTIAA